MTLTDLAIRHARTLGKAYRLSDCHRLYIQVNPSELRFARWDEKMRPLKVDTFAVQETSDLVGLVIWFG
ncbi:hypothetical protein SS08_03740 [Enterobacter hormaechei subsp. steigerwaltii]|jgi:hypothetical protein|nr:hypothetical protein LI62_03160 [Enterobacter hormaechei subsp. steigerwaltii]KJO33674.1 hypothetical protein SS08_03740 [Enterobacter hormaechei subsp. steigerwaltii]